MNEHVTSKSFDGITDLVIWAPIKDGFIDAFENITYETRLQRVAEALHKIRKSAREYETLAPFADTAERIQTLLDFRVGVVDRDLYEPSVREDGVSIKPRRYMYLVATFDGPWEPYIRLIWKPLGRFLDLLLCNCEGYVIAEENTFEDYAQWIRDNQLDSAIFYSTSGLTVKDQGYLKKLERYQREMTPDESDTAIARMTSDDPEDIAESIRMSEKGRAEATRLALEALTVLYRLADLYPPDRLEPSPEDNAEGRYLLRVAHSLLAGWNFDRDVIDRPAGVKPILRRAYETPLEWYEKGDFLASDNSAADKEPIRSEVQKGLLTNYDSEHHVVTHGAVFFLQISNAEKFRNFLKLFPFSWEDEDAKNSAIPDLFYSNIAFTSHGLTHTGLSQDQLNEFPIDFRDGMDERAEDFGDRGNNHPRRWAHLPRNWPDADDDTIESRPPVRASEIDVVFQFRTTEFANKSPENLISVIKNYEEATRDQPPLIEDPDRFLEELPRQSLDMNIVLNLFGQFGDLIGLKLLSVESGLRKSVQQNQPAPSPNSVVDHFGFRDGLSQPIPTLVHNQDEQCRSIDEVPYGDILCGYRNSLGDPASGQNNLLHNGSFLVIRKISQDVSAFNKFLDNYEMPAGEETPKYGCRFNHGELAARLVGRQRNGTPLIQPAEDNEFTYDNDESGDQCPFSAHIRLANPRSEFQGRPDPRILRRGMMYGDRYSENTANDPRGIIFMAYNANISEQYEVIQRWLNGGNPTNTFTEQSDPLTADVIGEDPKTFRFIKDGEVRRVSIEQPFTNVRWGAYLFAPSRTALKTLSELKEPANTQPIEKIEKGKKTIAKLKSLDAETQRYEWKLILEDFLSKDVDERAISSDVWEAIIADGGALRIESGVIDNIKSNNNGKTGNFEGPVVLVAEHDQIIQVLSDHDTYSMIEQNNRCKNSVGPIYVSQDPDKTYYEESTDTNKYLFAETEEQAFQTSYYLANRVLDELKLGTQKLYDLIGKEDLLMKVELRRQFLRPTLGLLCKYWFGIPDGTHIELGSWDWTPVNQRKPNCPGDFMAPSRYGFYPRPKPSISEYGIQHGKALREAGLEFVKQHRGGQPPGTISKQMFDAIVDDEVLARNIIGIMVGALPPMDANIRGILYDWITNKLLWRNQGVLQHQIEKHGLSYETVYYALGKEIKKSMSKRPAPDLIYRTARKKGNLGTEANPVMVNEGDTVILCLAAATQHQLNTNGTPDIDVVFGSKRIGEAQPAGTPQHACPAYKMAMGSTLGIIAALLNSGKLKGLPASLILEISDWELVEENPTHLG